MVRVGIAGLGTVGGGVCKLVQAHANLLEKRCHTPITITAVSARDRSKDRGFDMENIQWFENPVDLATSSDVDIVVELIGGESGAALDLSYEALNNRKHLVTANKALIAHHGLELAQRAKEQLLQLRFEAAVAGGIPVIKGFKEGLSANQIQSFMGILNGTCNFILSNMEQTKRDFATILEEAQALGYAEADPTFDVDGIDSAHKLAILASIAFGTKIDFKHVHIEGIRDITPLDIGFADELGYRIKLLGIGMLSNNAIEQRVHPCLVSKDSSIAKVSGVNNAVSARGDMVGDVLFEGPGAGELATASSVVADIVDVALKRSDEPFGVSLMQLDEKPTIDIHQRSGCYYLRVTVADQSGVLASVSDVFKEHDVSLETILQRPLLDGQSSIVAATHAVKEQVITKALEKIQKLDSVVGKPQMIRIEQ